MSLERLQHALRSFVAECDLAQLHSPQNLARSISIEAGELLEEFRWDEGRDPQNVHDELENVLTYCCLMAGAIGADPLQVVREKLAKTREKHPIEKARGRSAKPDELDHRAAPVHRCRGRVARGIPRPVQQLAGRLPAERRAFDPRGRNAQRREAAAPAPGSFQ